MRGLKEKVVIVTGAGGGIGGALVKRFCEEGANVVACDINEASLLALTDRLKEFEGQITPLVMDITDHAGVAAKIGEVTERLGRIDVLVNNAGWDVLKPFVETSPDFWQKLVDINLMGPLNLQHAVLPIMIAKGGGKIVNISSDAGRVGSSGESVYSACKGGIIAFSKTLARETARHNVRVNVVCPGPTDTAILRSFVGEGDVGKKIYDGLIRAIPLKRVGQPEDIPGMVAFLSSDDANFITGQVISVSGGLTMHG
ncbi:glucose 1-dehydrogenase [Aromatoleum bremense]|uniref:Glucose 1-dehydrogenase n=1 Tax=Aromatoleum bremense TaxID=76115 RepID=A0ABX1P046_9RHOO|nr:glucose 1-dehydrogenase [Aromatoleum bremense]NMG17027.1 glucose 1-dehydrogenase [Aromatoleum bremense]QTQ34174.1 Short-chain dehydrogenase/reductase, SDR family [Aromatoleum bremense]